MNRELPYINAFGTVDISASTDMGSALILSGLDWEVKSKPLFNEDGNQYDKFRANVRESDGKLLGIVTDKYEIVQNWEAFDFVDNLISEGFKFDRAGSFRDGRSIWVMGNFPKTQILGDDISNNIVFVNSHDGSSGVKVMMTPVRLVCSNMMNLALKRANRIWATKHTRSIFSKMEEAKYTLGLANKYIEELNFEAERLAKKKITETEIEAIFDIIYPIDKNKDSERKINNISIIKDNFVQCYNESDISQFKGTAYGAINAMSDLVSHKIPTRTSENFYENSWYRLINGHSDFDKFYNLVK